MQAGDTLELAASRETMDAVEAIAASRRGRGPSSVELLAVASDERDPRAATVLEEGWKLGAHPRIRLAPPVDWDGICAADRSWAFHLHAWEPMAAPLLQYGQGGDARLLEWCVELALDWVGRYPKREIPSPSAWYDMAIGVRAFRLAYLIDSAAAAGRRPLSELASLAASLRLHLRVLAGDEDYRPHSNHGIFQAAGQLAAARRLPELPESAAALEQGRERLHELVGAHFAEDGVHREHSPGYHLMVLRTLLRLRTGGVLDDPEVLSVLARAEDAMAWLVAPVGVVPTVGDSDPRPEDELDDGDITSPALEFALTRGRSGTPPAETMRAFPAGGYAVARDAWATGPAAAQASYLIQAAGFHSRVHKHADDLSFMWYAHGHALLNDPGRFGYTGRTEPGSPEALAGFYYSHPSRMYVESTRAHNCLEIDGEPYRRRAARPYGSALVTAWADAGSGLVATECAATQLRTVRHTRVLLHAPGSWVLVVDHAIGQTEAAHDYVQRFHFGPELELVERRHGAVRLSVPGTAATLVGMPLDGAEAVGPVRGRSEPELLGWASPAPGVLVPAWTVAWRRGPVRAATFATLFALTEQPTFPAASCRLNATARTGSATWVLDGRRHSVGWTRQSGPLSATYEVC